MPRKKIINVEIDNLVDDYFKSQGYTVLVLTILPEFPLSSRMNTPIISLPSPNLSKEKPQIQTVTLQTRYRPWWIGNENTATRKCTDFILKYIQLHVQCHYESHILAHRCFSSQNNKEQNHKLLLFQIQICCRLLTIEL